MDQCAFDTLRDLGIRVRRLGKTVAAAQTFGQRAEQAGIAALIVQRLAQQWLHFGRAVAQQKDLPENRG